METSDYHINTGQYAKCIEGSKRIRWDIDRDVIRGVKTLKAELKLIINPNNDPLGTRRRKMEANRRKGVVKPLIRIGGRI